MKIKNVVVLEQVMYKKVSNRLSSPPRVQTEPEDLSSSPIPSVPTTRGAGSVSAALSVPGAPSSATAAWALSNNKLLVFCDIVLQHANYPNAFLGQPSCDEDIDGSEESCEETKSTILIKNERVSESPLNSVGESARESTRSSTSSTDSVLAELEPEEVDKETFESVSCWCGKPFAGRPMIECEKCLVWYHMSCEQIRRNNIPVLFQCSKCKEKRRQKKRSSTGNSNSSSNGPEESRRSNGKSCSSDKKRKSSSFSSASSNSSSSGIPGSSSPQSDSNMSPFPHATSTAQEMMNNQESASSAAITSELETSLRIQDDTPTKVPPPIVPAVKSKHGSLASRPRHRKSKSSGGGGGNEVTTGKKRKSGGGSRKTPGSTTTLSSVVDDVSNGLTCAVADGVGDAHHVPLAPGCQPPRLMPCFENLNTTTSTHLSSLSSSSLSTTNNDLLIKQSNLSSSTSTNNHTHFSGHHQTTSCNNSNNHHHHQTQRALPPPKLQPQVNVLTAFAASSSSPPPPPPLLLSSNFVVDHQQAQNPLILRHPHHHHHHHHHHQTGVVVGGGDNNPNHVYPFRE